MQFLQFQQLMECANTVSAPFARRTFAWTLLLRVVLQPALPLFKETV